jgi:acyl-CoA thioester hydrolase
VNIAFRKPARFNELLAVTVEVVRRGAASLTLAQEVRRADEVLASAEVRIACIDAERFAPVAIPAAVAARIVAARGESGSR